MNYHGLKASDSYSKHYSPTYRNAGDKTSWPELTRLIPFHRHGSESELENMVCSDQHLLKDDTKPGSKVNKIEDTGSNTSRSGIVSSVFVVHGSISDTPFQATNYSCKSTGCSSLEKKKVEDSAAAVGRKKNSAKNARQFHIGSSRKPQVSSDTHNHINELGKYVSCDIVSGVASEEEQVRGNHVETAGICKVFCDVGSGSKVELTCEHLQKAKNLPESQSKEQENTVSGHSSTSTNQRRSSQIKKAWKEEKKRVREEEMRRKLLAPKGQRVRLVSQQMLGVLINSNTEKVPFSTYQTAAPAMNETEFPTVEESRKQRMKINEDFSPSIQDDVHEERSHSFKVQGKLSNLRNNNSCCVQSSNAEEENTVPTNRMSGRNKKRKDPIQIDLVNMIKTRTLQCKGQGEKGGVSKVGRDVQKRGNAVRYSGNQLDASNPERKRGKKSEVPKKKKISVLKSAVLEERALRRNLRTSREQAQNLNIHSESSQKKADVTVTNSPHEMRTDASVNQTVSNTPLTETTETRDLCVTGSVLFEEVMGGGNNKKAGDLNSTEIVDLTHLIREKLNLSSDDQAKMLLQNVSEVPENAQEMIQKTEMQEDNCAMILSGSLKHCCTDVIQRLPVHSRRFREYCDNSLTVPLNGAVRLLLKDIVKFQDRQYHRDPVKAFAKRRYVLGFREVKKHLQLRRLKLIIVAPDLEVAKVKGGIDDTVAQLKEDSVAQGVTCLFALSRRELGFLTFKKVGVSSVGICSYEGSEENFKNVMESVTEARRHYEQQNQHAITAPTVGSVHEPDSSKDDSTNVTNQVIASLLSKLTEKSSGDSASVFLSAIEQTTNQETE